VTVIFLPHLVIAELQAEFGGWAIERGPHGTWSAGWCSPDGRSRRFIIERSPGALADALRRVRAQP
jgi:hypothetical protein